MDQDKQVVRLRLLCGGGLPLATMAIAAVVLRLVLGWPSAPATPLSLIAGLGVASLVGPALKRVHDAADAQVLAGQVATLVLAPLVLMASVYVAGGLVGILPTLRWLLVLLVGCGGYLAWREGLFGEGEGAVVLRGRRLRTAAEAAKRLARARAKSKLGELGQPVWGGHVLPAEASASHFAVVGCPGSGKTTTIMMLAKSVLAPMGQGQGCRAVFFDDKLELLPVLHGLGVKVPIITMNPFDKRGHAWDLAADVKEPAIIAQVAAVLASKATDKEGGHAHEAFFNSAVCDLLGAIMLAFTARGYNWTLRDLCLAGRDAKRVARLLDTNEETRARLTFLSDKQLTANVMASLRARMHLYDPVAAAWSHAPERLSLVRWLKDQESMLVLANNHEISAPLMNINRALFARLSQLLLSQTEPQGMSWVFMDEVRAAGQLEGLDKLLIEGRSKQVCCVLGFQDMDGLSEAYGERVAREMLGQCRNQAFLALTSSTTAEWASEMIGKVEIRERQESRGPQGSSVSYHIVERPAVMASELLSLDLLQLSGCLEGWFGTPYTGVFKNRIDSATLARYSPAKGGEVNDAGQDESADKGEDAGEDGGPKKGGVIDALQPRAASDQHLIPWSEDELRALGLSSSQPRAAGHLREVPTEEAGSAASEPPGPNDAEAEVDGPEPPADPPRTKRPFKPRPSDDVEE